MNEFFDTILKTISVTGAEQEMTELIQNYCTQSSVQTKTLPDGSIILVPSLSCDEKKTAIFVSIDSPGFIVLSIEREKAYLAPIGKLSEEIKNDGTFVDEYKNEYHLEKDGDDYFVKAKHLKVGDVLQPQSNITVQEEKVIGFRSGQAAPISTLLEWIKNSNIIKQFIAFTTGGQERSSTEAQIAKQLSVDSAILLGTIEEKGTCPVIVVKDGKNLSERKLLETVKNKLNDSGVPYLLSCSTHPITKSEDITAREGIPTLTIALPIQNKGKNSEYFSKETCAVLIQLLTTLFQEKTSG
jgi:putative aminopeptidase FrvX